MFPRRVITGLGLCLVLFLLSTAFASYAAAATDNVCISRYGERIVQRGTATCDSDASSVAFARGEGSSATAHDGGRAIVDGDRSIAHATGQDNIATVNGIGSEAVAENGDNNVASVIGDFSVAFAGNGDNNTATISGDNSDALAGNGDNNRAIISGDNSQASAQAAAGCDAVVPASNDSASCP